MAAKIVPPEDVTDDSELQQLGNEDDTELELNDVVPEPTAVRSSTRIREAKEAAKPLDTAGDNTAGGSKKKGRKKSRTKVAPSVVDSDSEEDGNTGSMSNPIDVDAFMSRREPVGSKQFVRLFIFIERYVEY